MNELLQINVSGHTEKKNGLTYLSWAWAWAEVLKIDPLARWHAVEYSDERGCARPCMYLADGTAMVKTEVTIKGETKVCLLPVMDHRNKAIKNPDAFAINTAIMRCMTKAISMHGLGLYIYAGEDLPMTDGDSLVPALEASIEQAKARKQTGVKADYLATNPQLTKERKDELDELALLVKDDITAYGAQTAFERIEEQGLESVERVYLATRLTPGEQRVIKEYSRAFHNAKQTEKV